MSRLRPARKGRSVASPALDHALSRLEGALGQLEAAARRRLEVERGRANLETELTLMQDDRARLAVEAVWQAGIAVRVLDEPGGAVRVLVG